MVRHEKMCQKIPADWHKTFAMVGLVGLVGLELHYTTLHHYTVVPWCHLSVSLLRGV